MIDLETRVGKDGRKRVWVLEWNADGTATEFLGKARGQDSRGVGESLPCEGQGMKKASSSESFSGTIVQQNSIG